MNAEIIGSAELWLGDCRDILPGITGARAVVTDPPFNVGKDYGGHDDNMPEAEYLAWLSGILLACAADEMWVVTPTAKMLAFWELMPLAQQVVIPMTAGYAVRSGWTQKFASILVTGKIAGNPWNLWEGIRHRGEGYFFKEETYGHPGYTPLPIMQRAVATSKAQRILEPFMGTGTTGVAAISENRTFVGIELNPKYFSIACRRIEQAVSQPRLFEVEATKPEQVEITL